MLLERTTASAVRYHEVHAVRSRRCSSPADGVTGGESLNKYHGKNVWTRNGRWRPRKRRREHHRAAPVSSRSSPVIIDNKIFRLPEVECRCCSPASLLSLCCRLPVGFFLSVLATADRSPPPRGRSPAEPRHKANCSYTVKED